MNPKNHIELLRYAPALVIYSYISLYNDPVASLQPGEVVIDINDLHDISPKQFRTAQKKLTGWGLCEFKSAIINGRLRTIGWVTNQIYKKSKPTPKQEVKPKGVIHRQFAHLSITIDDYNSLTALWNKEYVDLTINDIENYKLNTKYVSLHLTALKWLKKNFPLPKAKEEKYTPEQIKEARMCANSGLALPIWFDENDRHLL